MDIFQELFSDNYLFMVRRRLNKDYNIRNAKILHPEAIKAELIKMSSVIYDIICKSDQYSSPDTIEKITQIFIDNYTRKYGLVFPKFTPTKLETPQDYHNLDAYNEYKSVVTDRNSMTHTTREYDAMKRYRLARHVDKNPELPYAIERDYGTIRKIQNYAYTDDKIPDYDWELNNNGDAEFNWSKEPKDREVNTDFTEFYEKNTY